MAENEPFAGLLRRLRVAADLTREQLAEVSGITDRAISDMERAVRRGPRVRTVEAIAAGLDVSPEVRAELLTAARAGRAGAGPAAGGRLPTPRRVAGRLFRRLAPVPGTAPPPRIALTIEVAARGFPGDAEAARADRATVETLRTDTGEQTQYAGRLPSRIAEVQARLAGPEVEEVG